MLVLRGNQTCFKHDKYTTVKSIVIGFVLVQMKLADLVIFQIFYLIRYQWAMISMGHDKEIRIQLS